MTSLLMSAGGRTDLQVDEFQQRLAAVNTDEDLLALWRDALSTENKYRELFARQRESWEIPEVADDPTVFLVQVFGGDPVNKDMDNKHPSLWRRLSSDLLADMPRVFAAKQEQKDTFPIPPPAGSLATVPNLNDFLVSWDCLTEGLLRHLNWENVFCAGGAVAGCVAPLPEDITKLAKSLSKSRVARRQYFHETFLPGSDIDLFLYGLDEAQAVAKLQEIYDAVQAANPYQVLIVRSKHAITLVSQYPFRHVQVVLRLYNSPAEILMGFDVDACAVGFDGKDVWACPRTCLAHVTQTNTIDPLTRRSPSYEMRLAKYAARGFTVMVPTLDRSRIDPFLYEKRFDQTAGLARLLLLERLRTPQERLRYRLESQLKMQGHAPQNLESMIQHQMRQKIRQVGSLERAEGGDLTLTSAELSNYSTVFLPWGKDWTASRIASVIRKKEKILNKLEYTSTGRFVKRKAVYPIHLCAVGHDMDDIIHNPFPDDPPLPLANIPAETLETMVYGAVAWLVDNPGRQRIGSFTPIVSEHADEWMQGAYFSQSTEQLIMVTWQNKAQEVQDLLAAEADKETKDPEAATRALLHSRDFLGRSALHVAVLANAKETLQALLSHPQAGNDFWLARTPDGRLGLHWACLHNHVNMVQLLLKAREALIEAATDKQATKEALEIDSGDWEVKMSPLHYAVVLGHVDVARSLLEAGANARKVSVHKDKGKSESSLSLLAFYASECGMQDWGFAAVRPMAVLLFEHGASPMQVDTQGYTCWHWFATSHKKSSLKALDIVLELDKALSNNGKPRGLDIMDKQFRTPLYVATNVGNAKAVELFLSAGAIPSIDEDLWSARTRQMAADGIQNYRPFDQMQSYACPVILTVQSIDVPCLQAFFTACPELVHVVINSSQRRRRSDEKYSLLDMVDEFKSNMLGENRSRNRNRFEFEIETANKRLDYAKNARSEYDERTYEWFVWSIQIEREKIALEQAKERRSQSEEKEEDRAKEKEGLELVNMALTIIESAGGKRLAGKKALQNHPTPQHHPISFKIEPLQPFHELRSFSFDFMAKVSRGSIHISQMTRLGEGETNAVRSLMSAISASIDQNFENAKAKARICVADASGYTPLFQALVNNKRDYVEQLYFKATEQFLAFVQRQSKQESDVKQVSEEVHAAETEIALKHQLRRFNNLDIAAGEVPTDQGPTREQLRQKVELSALTAANQVSQSDNVIFSAVCPEFLLLLRSTVLVAHEPKLEVAKKRLIMLHPGSFPEDWVNVAVKLRPIELAVIREDTEAVKLLLNLAKTSSEVLGGSSSKADPDSRVGMGDEIGHQSFDNSVDEEEDDDEYDEDYDGEYEEEGDPSTNMTTPLSMAELRYLLTGEGSANDSFGNMSLIQLAVLVGNSSILQVLLDFAKEQSLPLGAVVSWKSENDAALADSMDEKALERLNLETKIIAGEGPRPYWARTSQAQLWKPQAGRGRMYNNEIKNGPTLLQFAFSVGAESTASDLMNGVFDDVLIDWLSDRDYISSLQLVAGKHDVIKPSQTAALWLAKDERSRTELLRRLVRPTAVDTVGRTALFYSPFHLLPVVFESGVKTLQNCGLGTDEAIETLVEVVSTRGNATVLAMAVASGNSKLTKALLNLGCNRSTTIEPNHWNALHYALQPFYDKESGKPNWKISLGVIKALLEGATENERSELLVSSRSEHTPLMLATNRCAPKEVVSYLLNATAACALDGISRRDTELNTVLHLAVKQALLQQALVEGSSQDPVDAILDYQQHTKLNSPLAMEENARGTLAVELALQSIIMVWNRRRDVGSNRPRFLNGELHHRRNRLGKGELPRSVLVVSDKTEDESEMHSDRGLYKKLKEAEATDGVRNPLTLQQVQQAKEHSARAAKKDVADLVSSMGRSRYHRSSNGSQEHSLPSGPPEVFAPFQDGRRQSYLG